jgi:hypothetical protein
MAFNMMSFLVCLAIDKSSIVLDNSSSTSQCGTDITK